MISFVVGIAFGAIIGFIVAGLLSQQPDIEAAEVWREKLEAEHQRLVQTRDEIDEQYEDIRNVLNEAIEVYENEIWQA